MVVMSDLKKTWLYPFLRILDFRYMVYVNKSWSEVGLKNYRGSQWSQKILDEDIEDLKKKCKQVVVEKKELIKKVDEPLSKQATLH